MVGCFGNFSGTVLPRRGGWRFARGRWFEVGDQVEAQRRSQSGDLLLGGVLRPEVAAIASKKPGPDIKITYGFSVTIEGEINPADGRPIPGNTPFPGKVVDECGERGDFPGVADFGDRQDDTGRSLQFDQIREIGRASCR